MLKNLLWLLKDKTIYSFRRRRERKKIGRLVERGLRLGKNVKILPGAEIESHYSYLLSIGDNTVISAGVRILCHDATTYHYLGFSRIGRINIGRNCLIGEKVIILPGVTIGDNSLISIGSVVNKDIPPNSRVAGNPARVYGKFDELLEEHSQEFAKRPQFEHALLLKARFNRGEQDKIREALNDGLGYSVGSTDKNRFNVS